MKKQLLVFAFFCSAVLFAQTTIKGSVYDIYLEPLAYISVSTEIGSTVTDEEGSFTLIVKQTLPLKIKVSGVGYQGQTIEVTDFEEISVVLERKSKLQEVVLSASRTSERVLESPVTIERVGVSDIKSATSVNFYENFANLKGIDVLNSSANVKNIVSNRGFANTENTRFVQLVDGVESTVPVFNYSLGNSFGISELDIATAEILPGASSALYGPNALNGILTMTSKNPFDHQGISTYVKSGVTTQDDRATKGFYDVGIRMARSFGDKFAAKANFTYQSGEEWHATDYRNKVDGDAVDGDRSDLGYDGINVYGDDVDSNLVDVVLLLNDSYTDALGDGQGIIKSELLALPNIADVIPAGNRNISRYGYNEVDLIDTGYKSANFSSSLHYRPWANNNLEIIGSIKYSLSDNILHANERLKQTDGLSQQYALEFKGKNFFVKGYYSQHNANLVDPNITANYINTAYLDNGLFFAAYAIDYVNFLVDTQGDVEQSLIGASQSAVDGNYSDESIRLFELLNLSGFDLDVDDLLQGAPKVGSARFNKLKDEAESLSVSEGGSSLVDRSGFYHVDANYNFSDIIKFADIQVGGSYRDYELRSDGQIYSDQDSPITFKEFGIYTQLQKKLADDRIKLAITGRYDKSKNFDGNFSPRASMTYAAGSSRNHNFRASFQTGFRNPTTQDQYAALDLGNSFLLGTTQDNLDRFSQEYVVNSTGGFVILDGDDVINNSFTSSSVDEFLVAVRNEIINGGLGTSQTTAIQNTLSLLEKADIAKIKPETVQTIELGYRGAAKLADNLFEIDAAAHYSVYNDLITQKSVVVPYIGSSSDADFLTSARSIADTDFTDIFVKTNSKASQVVYGFNVGVTTKVFGDFDLGANYSFSKNEEEDDVSVIDEDIENAFNTPENAVKIRFGHDNLFKNFGFNVNARWQDEFLYNSVFVDAIIEARTVLDAQVNYTVPKIKSTFKVGAVNLGGKTYTSVPGSGLVGSQYYVSWTINN